MTAITLEAQETPRKIAFAHAYMALGNASEAYRLVYEPGEHKNRFSIGTLAHRLLKDPIVRDIVGEIKSEWRDKTLVTMDSLLAELDEAREAALGAVPVQASAAVSATMAKAKLSGLDVNRVQVTGPNGGPLQSAALVFATTDPNVAAQIYGEMVGK